VKSLVARGAVGLVTTHDLALTLMGEDMKPQAANFHFEDHLENGELRFDYRSGIDYPLSIVHKLDEGGAV